MSRFMRLYRAAFEEDGRQKACGREVRQELILLANQIEPSVSHGDAYTGMMDVEAIKTLYSSLQR